jgi:thioredoxin-like negative regulator of GroEL
VQVDRAHPGGRGEGVRRAAQGGQVNVDENQSVPAKFGIRGIPTLMLFKNGNVEATRVGALTKSQLTAFLDSNI